MPLEELNVEVADRSGQLLGPLELVAQPRPRGRVVDVLELAQDRPSAADRDAEVVKELRVQVRERARDVDLGDLQQAGQHLGRGGVGARAGGERDARLGRDALGQPAGRDHRLVEERLLSGLELAQDVQHPPLLGVVAEHGLHGQPRRQRHPPPPADHRLGPLDREPHDRLALPVEHCERLHDTAHAYRRQQRTLLEHAREPVAHGALRQLLDEVARRLRDLHPPDRGARLMQRERPVGPFGAQSLGAQPPVEAVEQHAVERALAPHVGVEPLAQQRERRGAIRQQQSVGTCFKGA